MKSHCVLIVIFVLLSGCMVQSSPNDSPRFPIDHEESSETSNESRPDHPDDGRSAGNQTARNPSSTSQMLDNADGNSSTSARGSSPYVVAGVADTGFNVYHAEFRRPDNIQHPCLILKSFSCAIPTLNLTLDNRTYEEAFEADRAKWSGLKNSTWYWIPGTVFAAVSCQHGPLPECLLANGSHGTGTISAYLSQSPDSFVVARAGNDGRVALMTQPINVDLVWQANGPLIGVPIPSMPGATNGIDAPLWFQSTGNSATPAIIDSTRAAPWKILVGGAFAKPRAQAVESGGTPEIVSHHCGQVAAAASVRATHLQCGTSIAVAIAAGGAGRALYELRNATGFSGIREGPVLNPVTGTTTADFRSALNRTATYNPSSETLRGGMAEVPLLESTPWIQWGWGFYDSSRVSQTIASLRSDYNEEGAEAPIYYMEGQMQMRRNLY